MLKADINLNTACQLPAALTRQITRVAGWQEAAGPNSRGRSGLITLEKPVPVRVPAGTFWLRSVKIKGLGDFSKPPCPKIPQPVPHQGWASFFWQVDPKGNISAVRPFPLFKGGLEIGKAENEYRLSQKAIEAGVSASLPLGWGIYPDITYRDQQAGFVILGLDEPRDRRWGRLLKAGDLSDRGQIEIDPDLKAIIKREMSQRQMPQDDVSARQVGLELFAKWSRSLRRLHDAGIIHQVPHEENYSVSRLISGLLADCFLVHDLDLSLDTAELNDKQVFLYRLIDLAYLMRSVNLMSLTPFGLFLNLEEGRLLKGETYRAVCRGYFGEELVEREKELVKTLVLSMTYANNRSLSAAETRQTPADSAPLDPRHAELDLAVQQMAVMSFYDPLALVLSEQGIGPPYDEHNSLKIQVEKMRVELIRAQNQGTEQGLFARLRSRLGRPR